MDRVRHGSDVRLALDDTGAGDEEQRGFAADAADGNVGNLEILNHIDYQTTKVGLGVTAYLRGDSGVRIVILSS